MLGAATLIAFVKEGIKSEIGILSFLSEVWGLSSLVTTAVAMAVLHCYKAARPFTTSTMCIPALLAACSMSGRSSAANFKLSYNSLQHRRGSTFEKSWRASCQKFTLHLLDFRIFFHRSQTWNLLLSFSLPIMCGWKNKNSKKCWGGVSFTGYSLPAYMYAKNTFAEAHSREEMVSLHNLFQHFTDIFYRQSKQPAVARGYRF